MALKVLKLSEKYLTGMGIDIQTFGEKTNFFVYIIRIYVFTVVIGFTISAITLTCTYWPQMEIVGLGAVWIFVGLQSTGIFLSFILKLDAVKSMHIQLQQFIDEQGELIKIF